MAEEAVYLRPDDYELETLARDIGDAPFWSGLLRRERPTRVLEIGSGCGRLTLPLARLGAKQGYSITGLEMELAMLRRAHEHAQAETPETQQALRLAQGDARNLDASLRSLRDPRAEAFDVILAPFGVAHHLTTADERLSVWRGARRWLRTGGLLAVDVTAPNLARMAAGLTRETSRQPDLEVDRDGRALSRTIATRYHAATQMETLSFVYTVRERDRSSRIYQSTFEMYVYFPRELETLFRASGFALEQLVGAYSGEPYGPRSPQLIALGRAEE